MRNAECRMQNAELFEIGGAVAGRCPFFNAELIGFGGADDGVGFSVGDGACNVPSFHLDEFVIL